jgi:hypothetical protein
MTRIMMAAALAALLGTPALAQSPGPKPSAGAKLQTSKEPSYARPGYGSGRDSPYRAFGAVTPFGSPAREQTSEPRDSALRKCSEESRKYQQTTWGNMDIHQHRACMAQRGQTE